MVSCREDYVWSFIVEPLHLWTQYAVVGVGAGASTGAGKSPASWAQGYHMFLLLLSGGGGGLLKIPPTCYEHLAWILNKISCKYYHILGWSNLKVSTPKNS